MGGQAFCLDPPYLSRVLGQPAPEMCRGRLLAGRWSAEIGKYGVQWKDRKCPLGLA